MSDQMTNEEAIRVLLGPTQREVLQDWCDQIIQAYDEKRLISMDIGVIRRDELDLQLYRTVAFTIRK